MNVIDKAIELARKIESLDVNEGQCPICNVNVNKIDKEYHSELCEVGQLLDLLTAAKAEPPAGESSKEFRQALKSTACQESRMIGVAVLEKACVRLDAQQREIEKLKANPECPNCSYRKKALAEQPEIDRLTAENKRLKKKIEELKTEKDKEQAQQMRTNGEIIHALDSGINRIQTLTAEKAELNEQLAKRQCVTGGEGYCGYSQQTMDALVKERNALAAENMQRERRIESLTAEKQSLTERIAGLEQEQRRQTGLLLRFDHYCRTNDIDIEQALAGQP